MSAVEIGDGTVSTAPAEVGQRIVGVDGNGAVVVRKGPGLCSARPLMR